MALKKLNLRPGIDKQLSPTLNEGGWTDGNLVRFRDGPPQPIGGWQKLNPALVQGVARALHAWAQLDGSKNLAIGTTTNLQMLQDDMLYDLTPPDYAAGAANAAQAAGWSAGTWGTGSFGMARDSTVNVGSIRLWSLDNWGEELVACPRGGPIYDWQPSTGPNARAAILPAAPTMVGSVLTGLPERHLIAFGAEVGGVYDPMLVRWSDVENYGDWTATATNSAGSFRLGSGSEIVGRLPVAQETLVFTDDTLYGMRFIGLPYVYSFVALSDRAGLLAPNAAVTAAGMVFWMSERSFMTYQGAVRPLPCRVWDAVFGNMNLQQVDKVHAGSNVAFGEVWWFYPSAGSIECDSMVLYNYLNDTWSLGGMARTAWIDVSVLPNPTAVTPGGQLYSHESGTTADGAALGEYVTSGFIDLSDGDEVAFIDQVLPDFSDQVGAVNITVSAKMFPNDAAAKVRGPFAAAPGQRYLSPRLRGRQLEVSFAGAAAGSVWRLGAVRVRISEDGRQ